MSAAKILSLRRHKDDLKSKAEKFKYAEAAAKEPRLMYQTRGDLGAKDRFAGDRVLDEVPQPQEFKKKRKDGVNDRNVSFIPQC